MSALVIAHMYCISKARWLSVCVPAPQAPPSARTAAQASTLQRWGQPRVSHAGRGSISRRKATMPKRIVCCVSARLVWCETVAVALCLECVSRVEPALPAKIALDVSAVRREAARLVTRAHTRRHRGRKRV